MTDKEYKELMQKHIAEESNKARMNKLIKQQCPDNLQCQVRTIIHRGEERHFCDTCNYYTNKVGEDNEQHNYTRWSSI